MSTFKGADQGIAGRREGAKSEAKSGFSVLQIFYIKVLF